MYEGDMSKMKMGVATLTGFLGYFLFRLVGVSFETMLTEIISIVVALVIGCPLGLLAGHLISRDSDVDTTAYRVIAWANLVSWLAPVIGMTVSSITYQFSRRSYIKRKQYWWLSFVGGMLAFANAGIGGAIEMTRHREGIPTTPIDGHSLTAERSAARCAFAAQEAWSNADFETYCRHPQ